MSGFNEIIHQRTRLRIMAALDALPGADAIEFTRLQALLDITPGNLGAHASTLEEAGYVDIRKDFVRKRPRTRLRLTKLGRTAFASHVASLRELLDQP